VGAIYEECHVYIIVDHVTDTQKDVIENIDTAMSHMCQIKVMFTQKYAGRRFEPVISCTPGEHHTNCTTQVSLLICFNYGLTNVLVEFIEFTFIAHLTRSEMRFHETYYVGA
jgi:hypothetical protein